MCPINLLQVYFRLAAEILCGDWILWSYSSTSKSRGLANQIHPKEIAALALAAILEIGQGDFKIHQSCLFDGLSAELALTLCGGVDVDLFFART